MRARPLLFVLALLAAAPAAFAQTLPAAAFVGHPVAADALTIEGRQTSEPRLLALIATTAGKPLSMADVRETITHFFSLGRFEDVRVDAIATPDGRVRLTYDLTPVHTVTAVVFQGTLGLPESTLRERLVERYGATPPAARANDVARALEQLYAEHGYLRASVRAQAVRHHDPDRTVLEFDIASGQRARVGRIAIEGQPMASRQDLLGRLDLAPGSPYERVDLDQRLSGYVDRLRHRGYYQATASQHADVSADRTVANVTVDVEAGPFVTIRFTGDSLPKEKRADLVPVEREGSIDQDLLEDSTRRIAASLQQQGYWKAAATYREQETDGHMTIVFDVHRGPQYHVAGAGVSITGNAAVPADTLRALVKLPAGEPFIASRLDDGVNAITGLYQTRGFAQVQVHPAANELSPGIVQPVITIVEGPRTLVQSVTVTGNHVIATPQLLGALKIRAGEPYYAPTVAADRETLRLEYLNRGYESAEVTVHPTFSTDGTRADVPFAVVEGPQTIVDHILIVGNTRTDAAVIERELRLKSGQPLGLDDLIESQRRLSALGLFRRVRITPLTHGPAERRDVLITVEEAQRTTVSYGGGGEIDRRLLATGPNGEAQEHFEFAPRGFFDIDRRNLGGKNRSIGLSTRLSLRPKDAPDTSNPGATGFGFAEYRVVGTYREPRVFGENSDFTVTAAVEQGVRTSFNFARKGVNAELTRRLGSLVRANFRYSFGTTRTFDEHLRLDEQVAIDRLFPQVRLSTVSVGLARDARDDLLEPHAGTLLSADSEIAGRAMGSQVGFAKVFLQSFWYHPVGARNVVFATGARLGLATGFPRETQTIDEHGGVTTSVLHDIPASERFFAGGDTTIRGFALDTVGTPATISPQGFPIGGNAMLVLNAELRVPIWRELGGAVFVDGGNVFDRVSNFDLGELRGATGFGLRYKSPLGPIRVDLGFKMARREIAGQLEPRTAWHFSIGQAF
ncbi:MAG TPA: POTRA domain-containing protein [Vicinamibacterales bacterium]|nr:POTRA domain-containing protein [Vicinamibacterales bacterium]